MELFIIFFLVALLFLAKEFLKKGCFLQDFLLSSKNQVVHWEYEGAIKRKPGMYNVVLTSSAPFSVLLGFELKIFQYTGYDPYGFVSSDKNNQIIISTYLGRKPVVFRFLVNIPNTEIQFSSTSDDQKLIPTRTYPPHWWQKMGFYG